MQTGGELTLRLFVVSRNLSASGPDAGSSSFLSGMIEPGGILTILRDRSQLGTGKVLYLSKILLKGFVFEAV